MAKLQSLQHLLSNPASLDTQLVVHVGYRNAAFDSDALTPEFTLRNLRRFADRGAAGAASINKLWRGCAGKISKNVISNRSAKPDV